MLYPSSTQFAAFSAHHLVPLRQAAVCFSMSTLQEAVQVLLKHSADVNARDKNWQTPLHVAAANKAVRCAEALVPLLSNVNVSDRAGRTALHHAAFSGHLEVSVCSSLLLSVFTLKVLSVCKII